MVNRGEPATATLLPAGRQRIRYFTTTIIPVVAKLGVLQARLGLTNSGRATINATSGAASAIGGRSDTPL